MPPGVDRVVFKPHVDRVKKENVAAHSEKQFPSAVSVFYLVIVTLVVK